MIDDQLNNTDSKNDQFGLPTGTTQVEQEIQKLNQSSLVNQNISQVDSHNTQDLEPVLPEAPQPKSKLRLILLLALLAAVVIGLVAGLLLWRYHYSDDAIFSDMLDNNLQQNTVVFNFISKIDSQNSYRIGISADIVGRESALEGELKTSFTQGEDKILLNSELREVNGKGYFNLKSLQIEDADELTQADFQESISSVTNKWIISNSKKTSPELDGDYGFVSPWTIHANEINPYNRYVLVRSIKTSRLFNIKTDKQLTNSKTVVFDVATSRQAYERFLKNKHVAKRFANQINPFDSLNQNSLDMHYFVDRDTRVLRKIVIDDISDPLNLGESIASSLSDDSLKAKVSLTISFKYDKFINVETPLLPIPESTIGI